SPLTILEKERLDALGATDIKEIVRSLSFNAGSLGVSATNWAGDDSSTGNASVNLRNLGSGATLVLINGKRTVNTTYDNSGSGYVDVQGLVPNIALERIEVVKDGASALYGSDAVAGVVNFITRRGFDGVELQVDFSSDDETHEQQDLLLSGLAGTTGDWGAISLAASYLERSGLSFAARFARFGRSGLPSFGHPGRCVPPVPP
ncbi:MAG: TonB-dependent receptor plug domain-containing protein, partial [Gammaproteobacteria bacterium]|nr:TonB-dependent receptor plug domain-containing protein [Gammaproteobacteria bacterium]